MGKNVWLTARLFIQSVSGDGATLVRLCVSIISSPHSHPSYVVMHHVWCILKKQKTKNCTDPFSTATHLLVAVFFSFLNLSVKTRLPAESRNKKQVWVTTNGSLHKNRAPLALTVLKELAGNVWSQNWFFFSPTQMYDGAVLPHSQPSSDHSLGATGSGQHGSLIWVDFPIFDNSATHFSPGPLSLWQPILCCPFTEHKLTTGDSCRYCPKT